MEMKNDFAKSILDSPYNKIVGGKEGANSSTIA